PAVRIERDDRGLARIGDQSARMGGAGVVNQCRGPEMQRLDPGKRDRARQIAPVSRGGVLVEERVLRLAVRDTDKGQLTRVGATRGEAQIDTGILRMLLD